jgi:NAD(P)-dependent dehydrogenase (short-subunit alcohol dehydrogenase family)
VKSIFEQTQAQLGPINILVNNAGITYSKKFHETPDEVWEQIIQTNVNGMFYCCKAAIPEMIIHNWGRIITIASIAALSGLPYSSAYSASKHAQLGLTRTLALEMARYNIAVNAICPGWVETDMLEETIKNVMQTTGRSSQEARAAILKLSGQSRAIIPQEVAAETLRLACLEDATFTGQAITLL